MDFANKASRQDYLLKQEIEGGGEITVSWTDITDKPAVIASGTTQATARASIGAGTSNLALGTTGTTAKAGDYQPTWTQVTSKPTTFPSTWSTVSGIPAALTAAQAAGVASIRALGTTATTALAGTTPILSAAAITAIGALTPTSTLEEVIAALQA